MKTQKNLSWKWLTMLLTFPIAINAQTLYAPNIISGIGTSTAGNVGIGISNPTAKLEVASPASGAALKVGRVSGNPSIQGTSDWFILDNAGTYPLALNYWSSSNISLAVGGGIVSIGQTNPQGKLSVIVPTNRLLQTLNAKK